MPGRSLEPHPPDGSSQTGDGGREAPHVSLRGVIPRFTVTAIKEPRVVCTTSIILLSRDGRVAMKLFVDHRERRMVSLVEDVGAEVTVTQLPIGDYVLLTAAEAVVVERKTVPDFLASVRSNRLWDQLLRMMARPTVFERPVKRRLLLIHGRFQDYFAAFNAGSERDLAVSWSQLMGAYLEVVYAYNTPIIVVETDLAFHAFMRILVQREAAGKNDKLPSARWYMKPVKADLPVKDRKQYILSSLPYIGNQLAENLLSHFGTISQVACASVADLQQVPRIGKKKAELIYTLFHS
jgi:ERCC4-type nuclease